MTETYNVEKIVGHKPKSAKTASEAKHYHVKWEGFNDTENTWEPAENFNEPLLKEYWESNIPAKDVAEQITPEEEVTKSLKKYLNRQLYFIK